MRRFVNGIVSLLTLSFLLLVASFVATAPALAVSDKFLDVCASGCTYSTLPAALAAVSSPSSDNRYTIFVDAGVLESDTSIDFGGVSYVTIQGRGIGASVIRASAAWFESNGGDFIDLTDCHDVTFRGVTIDAASEAPAAPDVNDTLNAVLTDNAHNLLFDSSQILGIATGIWETTNSAGHRIDVTNSIIRARLYGIYIVSGAAWHIFSSDIRAVRSESEDFGSGTLAAVDINAPSNNPANVTIWGSHLHAEFEGGQVPANVSALRYVGDAGLTTIVGSTLHVKTTAEISSGGNSAPIMLVSASAGRINVVGSDLLYQTASGVSNGRFGGIGYFSSTTGVEVQLTGTNILDAGGSGGLKRTDLYQAYSFGSNAQPRFRFGSLHSAQTPQTGTVTLSSGSATVALSPTQADLFYVVVLQSAAGETLSVTSKSTSQFTISSSNGSSTAVVEYTVVR